MGSAEKDAILARAKLKPVIVGHCEVTNIKSFLKLFQLKLQCTLVYFICLFCLWFYHVIATR